MPTQITLNQLLLVGLIAGFVLGLIPLGIGFARRNRKLGIIGFVLTIVGGTFFSLLGAIPIAAVFSWLILRKPAETTEDKIVTENLLDASAKESENI